MNDDFNSPEAGIQSVIRVPTVVPVQKKRRSNVFPVFRRHFVSVQFLSSISPLLFLLNLLKNSSHIRKLISGIVACGI
jgi:hypothetical protein